MSDYSKIDIELINRLCDVAKLNLTDEEKKLFSKELTEILSAFDIINKVDTKNISPAYHPNKVSNVWRDDIINETIWEPLSNSKRNENGYVVGPKIL